MCWSSSLSIVLCLLTQLHLRGNHSRDGYGRGLDRIHHIQEAERQSGQRRSNHLCCGNAVFCTVFVHLHLLGCHQHSCHIRKIRTFMSGNEVNMFYIIYTRAVIPNTSVSAPCRLPLVPLYVLYSYLRMRWPSG